MAEQFRFTTRLSFFSEVCYTKVKGFQAYLHYHKETIMKKLLLFPLTLFLSLGLAACSQSKPTDETASSVQSQQIVAKHSDIRLKFNAIKMAKADQEFKGGSSLAQVKELFGEPAKHEQVPAGDVTLDVYNWQFDQVDLTVQFYQDNVVVRSISNFYFIRDPKIGLKDFDGLADKLTYQQAVEKLGEPDVLSQAVSSDKEELQAIWVSGLKTDQEARIQLLFENNALKTKNQFGLKD